MVVAVVVVEVSVVAVVAVMVVVVVVVGCDGGISSNMIGSSDLLSCSGDDVPLVGNDENVSGDSNCNSQ